MPATASEIERRARRLRTITRWLAELGKGAEYAVLFALAGSAGLRDLSLGLARGHFYPGLAIAYGLLTVATAIAVAPFRLGIYLAQRHYGLAKNGIGPWLWRLIRVGSVIWVATVPVIFVLYAFLRAGIASWWVWAALTSAASTIALTYFQPRWILPRQVSLAPLEESPVAARIGALCARAGIALRSIQVARWSEHGAAANAWLSGWGRTRTLVLSDTLLANLTPEEVEAVVAHELGHLARRDVERRCGMGVAATFVIFGLLSLLAAAGTIIGQISPSLAELADLAYLANFLLAIDVLSVLSRLWLAARSRQHELAADRFSWRFVRVETFIAMLEKLSALNLTPTRASGAGCGHPAPAGRIAAARAFAQRPVAAASDTGTMAK